MNMDYSLWKKDRHVKRALKKTKFVLHDLKDLGSPNPRAKVEFLVESSKELENYTPYWLVAKSDKLLTKKQHQIEFAKIFQRPKDEDDNRIHHREAEKYKDNIRDIVGESGNHYQFKTNNMPWSHNTIVWCNEAIIFVFPIGFAHNYNFSKFCNWVVNSIFEDKC